MSAYSWPRAGSRTITLAPKAWYRHGSYSIGQMLVFAGRYLVAISSLVSPLLVIDFGGPGAPALAASADLGARGKDLALDPARVRLYVLTRSLAGSQGGSPGSMPHSSCMAPGT